MAETATLAAISLFESAEVAGAASTMMGSAATYGGAGAVAGAVGSGYGALYTGLSAIGTVGTALSTVGTIGSMVTGISNGMAQADFYESQAQFQQQQFELQQASIATQAAQDEVLRRRQLAGILSSQQAFAAAHGMDLSSSGSLNAAEQGSIAQAESDIQASRTTAANRELMTNLQASQAALTSAFKEAQGYGEVAGSIFTGGVKLAETGATIAQKIKSNNLTG